MSAKAFTIEEIKKIASLSKLELSDSAALQFSAEFSEIAGFVDRLQELDLTNIEPLEQISAGETYLRSDLTTRQHDTQSLLTNAPDQVQNLVRVPRVIN